MHAPPPPPPPDVYRQSVVEVGKMEGGGGWHRVLPDRDDEPLVFLNLHIYIHMHVWYLVGFVFFLTSGSRRQALAPGFSPWRPCTGGRSLLPPTGRASPPTGQGSKPLPRSPTPAAVFPPTSSSLPCFFGARVSVSELSKRLYAAR